MTKRGFHVNITKVRKSTIATSAALALFLLSSVVGVHAASSPSSSVTSYNIKASHLLVPALVSKVALALSTPNPSNEIGNFGNASPSDGNLPGKSAQVPGASANSPVKSSLNIPVVQGMSITGAPATTSTADGLNAYNLWSTHLHFNVEPPDQMLCASGNYVFEGVNDNVQVFNKDLTPAGPVQTIEDFFQLPTPDFFFSLSDPKCVFDSGSGHWFVTTTFPFVAGFSAVFLAGTCEPIEWLKSVAAVREKFLDPHWGLSPGYSVRANLNRD